MQGLDLSKPVTLVTGGLGFIGSAIVARLAQDRQVHILDNGFRGSKDTASFRKNVRVFRGDMCRPEDVRKAMGGVDTVYHLGAINGTRHFYEIPGKVLEVNVLGMIAVMEEAIAQGAKRFLFSSSSEVYQGGSKIPTPEDTPLVVPDLLNPRYSYGGSKIFGELWCTHYGVAHGLNPLIVRYHNIYGPSMGNDHVIPELLKKVYTLSEGLRKTEISLEIQGNGEETRAFCYIDDAVEGTLVCEHKGKELLYHIGNETEEIRVKDLVTLIGQVTGIKIALKKGPLRPGSVLRRCPDISRLRTLGYEPKVSLEEGLKKTWEWYRKQFSQEVAHAH
jgi:nucleoside-diphosphate-sugar epimerase